MFSFSEAQEIAKRKDTSACILGKKAHILLPELDMKVESGKEQEEEDDYHEIPLFKP
jgi:hypothetical protein